MPEVRAVLTRGDAGSSELVHYAPNASGAILPERGRRVLHDPGAPPAALFLRDRALVCVAREHRTDLWSLPYSELPGELLISGVTPRLSPLVLEDGTIVVSRTKARVDRGTQLAAERFSIAFATPKGIVEPYEVEAFFLWPFGAKGSTVYVLQIDTHGTRILAMNSLAKNSRAGPELVADLGRSHVRDPVVTRDGLVVTERTESSAWISRIQRGVSRRSFEIKGASTLLGRPVGGDGELLVSISPAWDRGFLQVVGPRGAVTIELPDGSPIPLAAEGTAAVVRVQSQAGHRHFALDVAGCGAKACVGAPIELVADGVLSSVQIAKAKRERTRAREAFGRFEDGE